MDYKHCTSITFDGNSNFQLNFSGSAKNVQAEFEKSCINRKAIWANLLDQKTGRTIASYSKEHGLQTDHDPAIPGATLANLLNDHHCDEWLGSAIASALSSAIERMTFSKEQYAILTEEAAKLGPNFRDLAPKTDSPDMG